MVFQREDDTFFLGVPEAFLNGLDDPPEALVLSVAGEYRLHATVFHEFVERLGGVPAAGVEADAGNAEFVGDVDAVECAGDLAGAVASVGVNKVLVDGKAYEIDAVDERVAFQGLQVGRGFTSHLDVENIDALCTVLGGVVDDFLDWVFLGGEMPIGISGDAQLYTGFDGLGKGGGGASSKRQ